MIRAALTFFVLAIIASLLGASSAGGMTTEIGHFLLLVFLVLAIVAFSFGTMPMDEDTNGRRDYDKNIF